MKDAGIGSWKSKTSDEIILEVKMLYSEANNLTVCIAIHSLQFWKDHDQAMMLFSSEA